MKTETIEYKGFNIDVYYDEYAECPWEAWDTCAPLIAYSGGNLTAYGDISADYLPDLTRQNVKDNLQAILNFCGYQSLLSLCRDHLYSGDTIADAVGEAIESSDNSKLEKLEFAYQCAGIITLNYSARGYVQGAWADLLIVATPDWLEKTGAKIEKPADLTSEGDLWTAWAFGDVYYYAVEDENGEHIDSCGGFYGSDHEDSGLLDNAKNAIDWHTKHQAEKRAARLKDLIKNHVPLQKRAAELAGAAK